MLLVTLFCVMGSYFWFITQLCKLWLWHMSRFSTLSSGGSPSASPSGSLSGYVVFAPGAAAHSCGWPDAGFDYSASRSQQPAQANGVQLFQRSRTHRDKTSLLTGGLGRQAVVTPAGEGEHPLCGFFPMTNIKDLALLFGILCFPLFACHSVLYAWKRHTKC